ncbi:MAG: FecR domain-containing protein [Planctomycetes bacterium]|nr:FecR domain-containing protein [Planctomycetota bacterium]
MSEIPWDWDFLIHRHLSGEELTEEQRTALNDRLRKFPRLRKRLAELAFEQANLRDALTVSEAVPILIVPAEPAAAPLLKPLPAPAGRVTRPWILPVAAAAACLAIIAGIVIWSARGPEASFKLLAGDVKVEGSRVEVSGAAPARFRMIDGSEAELAPASAAVFRGRVGDARQVVELSQGTAAFKVAKAPDSFRVDTSVGRVSVLGTEFSVELRKQKKGPPVLAVSVTSGRVRVEAGSLKKELGPGESRVFGPDPVEKKDPPRPVFAGVVRGKVVAKGDAHLVIAVNEVVSSRKDSSAEAAAQLPGRTLKVSAAGSRRKDGEAPPDKMQLLFVRRVEIGQELTLDVRQFKGDEFTIGALSEEQVQWATPREERREEKDKGKKQTRDPEKGPDRGDKKED